MKEKNTQFRIKQIESKIKNPKRISLRRKQIIKGAIDVFTVKGFNSATTREIALAAGITEGTLFNYVRSKEDIIYIVYEYITQILRKDMEKAIAGITDPQERLKAALLQNMKTIDVYQDIIMFMYKESHSLDKESLYTVLAREAGYIEMFEELLTAYFGEKKMDPVKIKLAADLLSYIPVIVTFRRWSLKRRFDSMDAVISGILDFILHGIEFAVDMPSL
ncbi:TetR/AcrR family transcriptional regulator [Desulfatirhabdium butyrativorans]|uniref:TetR/AcrR family transcriptional regulator n=1 Tax=Desulfatirhabdium butyrativorans TaxID=340467 RepID=UPI0012EC05B2|nr:TetR/AcrR family transcriptional regulator [Desulfatirhabdium butyrativorans]